MKKEINIKIEGADRSGKTLIGKLLYDFFQRMNIVVEWKDETRILDKNYNLDYSRLNRDKQIIIISSNIKKEK